MNASSATKHTSHVLRVVVVAGEEHMHCDTCGQFLTKHELLVTMLTLCERLGPFAFAEEVKRWSTSDAQPVREQSPGSPDDLRKLGWSVAVHNDYRLLGQAFTFWLFTKDGRAVKGEGHTDSDALDEVRLQVGAPLPSRGSK